MEAGVDEDGDWFLENQKELPDDVKEELHKLFPKAKEGELKIKIHFQSSGTYISAKTNGPVEDCYPSEYEDKRELDYVEVKEWLLSLPAAQSFYALFEEEINAVEIDFQG